MKKYCIDETEVWPEYTPVLAEDAPAAVEIHDAFIERYNKAAKEWSTVQAILGKHLERSEEQYKAWAKTNLCQRKLKTAWDLDYRARRCNQPLKDGSCGNEANHAST